MADRAPPRTRHHDLIRPRVRCKACGGGGDEPLADHLWAVLKILIRWGSADAAAIGTKLYGEHFEKRRRHRMHWRGRAILVPTLNVSRSAISNRLAALLAGGFVTREKEGKRWIFSAVVNEADRG